MSPSNSVSDAVLDILKSHRIVDNQHQPMRRKKISVPPGKSITCEDLREGPIAGCSGVSATEGEKGGSGNKQVVMDETSNDEQSLDMESDADGDDSQGLCQSGPHAGIFVCVGYYYVVQFPMKQSIKHYIGKVVLATGSNVCKMSFMRRFRNSDTKFVCPENSDEVDEQECVYVVYSFDRPRECRRGVLEFSSKQLQKFKKTLQ